MKKKHHHECSDKPFVVVRSYDFKFGLVWSVFAKARGTQQQQQTNPRNADNPDLIRCSSDSGQNL
jgi:hypothetical protein